MITIVVANAKGGVGKSTTAVHLATGYAKEGERVALVDLDPQANATHWLLGPVPPATKGAFHLLTSAAPIDGTEFLPAPGRENLTVAPATPSLRTADLAITQQTGGQMVLRESLQAVREYFDYVVVDCPPNLGLTVLSAICAADVILAPVFPAFMSFGGLQQLEETIALTRQRLPVKPELIGYLLFAADMREAITAETRAALKQRTGHKLYHAAVRVSAAAKALPGSHKTAWDQGVDARGRNDYLEVLRETNQRLEALGLA